MPLDHAVNVKALYSDRICLDLQQQVNLVPLRFCWDPLAVGAALLRPRVAARHLLCHLPIYALKGLGCAGAYSMDIGAERSDIIDLIERHTATIISQRDCGRVRYPFSTKANKCLVSLRYSSRNANRGLLSNLLG